MYALLFFCRRFIVLAFVSVLRKVCITYVWGYTEIFPPDFSLQRLLPTCHPATRLMMERAHRAGLAGCDATLAQFIQCCWVVAKSVKRNFQKCKLRKADFLQQVIGHLLSSTT